MELKSYFKKYGKGWIIGGFFVTFVILFTAKYTKYAIEEVVNAPWSPIPILTSLLIGVGVFLLGFFGFTRLFWLLISGESIVIVFLVLESGSEESWSLIFTIPLLILLGIIGIVWEIIHHIRFKNQQSQL